ncbi:hypothetical protein FB451DRAFT_1240187 [Mycena latifolia]|nr:hypothetical protein FB451DRAFT_1240187 [Mycena latifolia]
MCDGIIPECVRILSLALLSVRGRPSSFMATSYASFPRRIVSGVDAEIPDPLAGATSQLAFAVTTSVSFALVVWEYAALLPDEIKWYQKPVWGTIPPYAFLALRYGGFLATLPALFLSVAETSMCQAAASISQAGVILVVTSSAIIFTFRTSLLWPDNRIVPGVLGAIVVAMGISCTVVATQYKAISVPDPLFGSNCRILTTSSWYPLGSASCLAFVLPALILTLLKMQYHHPRDSLVAARIYRMNLAYLIGTTLTAAIALVLQSLAPPASALALSSASIATVLTIAFSTRAFRNLMLATVLESERAHGLPYPYPSVSPIISPASELRYAHPSVSTFTTATRGAHGSRPQTADSADSATARKNSNPYTTFPSPPSSHTSHSPLTSHTPSRSPGVLAPLRRAALHPILEPLKSGWSDS